MVDYWEAWKVSEKNFPHEGAAADKLAYCVRYALLAPSPYNTQPWYFRIRDNTVLVCADRRHALPVIDPDDREMAISGAAALFNLRLAIRYFGYAETVELSPLPDDEDVLARVVMGGKEKGLEQDSELLFKAIPQRHMNRGAFMDKQVPESALNNLRTAAGKEGAWLHVCGPHERKTIARLVMEADYIQTGSKNFRRELAAWMDQRRSLSGDGMPGGTMTYAQIMGNLAGGGLSRHESGQQLEAGAAVIAILGSKGGGRIERLHTGQALMRVLLQAEAEGLSVSTLNQPLQVPDLRLRLHDELEHTGRAQIILRIGYAGGKAGQTPRRELAQFIEFEGKGGRIGQGPGLQRNPRKVQDFVKRLLRIWR